MRILFEGENSNIFFSIKSSSISYISKNVWLMALNPVLMAIHLAVSNLSPVNIQTLIPASLSVDITGLTSS